MRRVINLYETTVGKKIVMALTGIMLVGFLIGHMVGNLKIYVGAEALDHYAHGLKAFGDPFLLEGQFVWIMRIAMLIAIALHIHAAISLMRLNQQARPVGYQKTTFQESNIASRTMKYGGFLIFAFIVYHILHFTTGQTHPTFVPGAVYDNVISGFKIWWVSLFYIVTMLAASMHLYHGVWSMLHTLGVNHTRYNAWRRKLALAIAIIFAVGNISIPVAVLAGFVH